MGERRAALVHLFAEADVIQIREVNVLLRSPFFDGVVEERNDDGADSAGSGTGTGGIARAGMSAVDRATRTGSPRPSGEDAARTSRHARAEYSSSVSPGRREDALGRTMIPRCTRAAIVFDLNERAFMPKKWSAHALI